MTWAIDLGCLLLGRSLTQDEISKGLQSDIKPACTLGDLERCVGEAGLDATVCRLTWEDLVEVDGPAVVWLRDERLGVVDTHRAGNLQIKLYSTPGMPGEWLSRSDMEEIWNGECLVLRRRKMHTAAGPVAMWDRLVFDFGTVGPDYADAIVFTVHNVGDEPLLLGIEKISCNCIEAQLDESVVPPGGVSFLRLKPDFTMLRGRNYSFSVLLAANDGRRCVARVFGQVLRPAITSTRRLALGDVMKGSERVVRFHIYDRGTHDLKFTNAEVSLEGRMSESMHASVEFIHWAGLGYVGDITTDVPVEPGDYIAVVRIGVKDTGVPGPFRGLLQIKTNQTGESARLDIPIDGQVVAMELP